MALNAENLVEAQAEARHFLEYSIWVLCSLLNIDPETVTSEIVIPVDSYDPDYASYVSLKKQLAALEALPA